jgi:hypothetical protein
MHTLFFQCYLDIDLILFLHQVSWNKCTDYGAKE